MQIVTGWSDRPSPLFHAMKIVNEDGTITQTKPGRLDRIPKRANSDKPICGSDKKNGGICHLPAGMKTNHVGYGRCWRHGGNLQEIGDTYGQLRWGNLQLETFPAVLEKAKALKAAQVDDEIFNLRDHIILMESIALTILERSKTMEDLGAALQYIEKCTKVIQRLDEIEHGRKLVIDYQGVTLILAKVQDAIERHVTDSYSKDLIARDLAGLLTEGTSGTDISNSQ